MNTMPSFRLAVCRRAAGQLKRLSTGLLLLTLATGSRGAADELLKGSVIGTAEAWDYNRSRMSTTVNTRDMAFDGNPSTFFASNERSYTWTGLDLGRPHVITRVGWMPRNDSYGPKRVLLGVFEGANRADFMDALPLYIIGTQGTIGSMSYDSVSCSMGFRYVRYVGPADARCNIAELEFYGHESRGDSARLYRLTNLPTVSIHTENGVIPYDKVEQIPAQLTVIGDSGTAQLLSEHGTIRERGNFSRTFPKKPFRIKFDSKQHVLDAPAKAKKWTLLNNYGDKTLLRNLMAFELSRRMGMPYTPYCRAVDVLLNGEYKGCYQLADQVEVGKHRVDIDKMTPQDNSGTAVTGGYLVEVDAYAGDEISMFYSSLGNPVTIHSPSDDSISSQQSAYIQAQFNQMESQWQSRLDLDTFLRHFLLGELSGNTDTYWSVYMYKQRDNDTIYTGPAWDFDLAFENDSRTYPVCSKNDYIYRSGGSCVGNMKYFVDRIAVYSAVGRARLQQLWAELRQQSLDSEQLVACLDSLEQQLQQSQQLNFLRWPIMGEYVHQNPRIWGSYTAEVQNVRRYIRDRMAWMDRKLGYDPSSDIDGLQNDHADIDYSQTYTIHALSGTCCGHDICQLPPGLYIIRQGKKAAKVLVPMK